MKLRTPQYEQEIIIELYTVQKMSMAQIASIRGHSKNTIPRVLKANNIPIRSLRKSIRIAQTNNPELRKKRSERMEINNPLNNPEVRLKHKEACREAQQRPEVKSKHSSHSKKMWEDPHYKKNMSQKFKDMFKDEKIKKRHREGILNSPKREEWLKKHQGKNNPRWNSVEVTCSNCGKLFERPKKRVGQYVNQYCSMECLGKHRKTIYSGEGSPTWRGGISFEPYCSKFNDEFKERVREFFKRTCQLCGKLEEGNPTRLSVHHVNYEKMVCCDNTPPLFLPLCTSCHTKTNSNREYWEYVLTEFIMVYFDGKSYTN